MTTQTPQITIDQINDRMDILVERGIYTSTALIEAFQMAVKTNTINEFNRCLGEQVEDTEKVGA